MSDAGSAQSGDFPLTAEEMSNLHTEWASKLWSEAGFAEMGLIHVVSLKSVLARVLQDGGESAPNRMAADTITRQLQSGRRHWDQGTFIEWCLEQQDGTAATPDLSVRTDVTPVRSVPTPQSHHTRSKPAPSRRNVARARGVPLDDSTVEASPNEDPHDPAPPQESPLVAAANMWAVGQVKAIQEDVVTLSSEEARANRVRSALSLAQSTSVSLRASLLSDLEGWREKQPLHQSDRAATVEAEVQAGIQEQQRVELAEALRRIEVDTHTSSAAIYHALELRRLAELHAANAARAAPESLKPQWQQEYWDSLRTAMEGAATEGAESQKAYAAELGVLDAHEGDTSTGELPESGAPPFDDADGTMSA